MGSAFAAARARLLPDDELERLTERFEKEAAAYDRRLERLEERAG